MKTQRLLQYVMAGVLLLALISVPLQWVLALVIPGGFMFIITGIITFFLALPLVLLLYATPPVTVNADGFTLYPVTGRQHFIAWSEVERVKPYPLIPAEEAETVRRLFVGRLKYRPAEGIMLIVPGLPFPYRIVGFFAGAGGKPVVAFTNRSHTGYEQLVESVTRHHPIELSPEETKKSTEKP